MQPNTDDAYWLALLLRNACRPSWSFKLMALSSISINTIAKRLQVIDAALPEDEQTQLAIKHQTIMVRAGLMLGLKPHEVMV